MSEYRTLVRDFEELGLDAVISLGRNNNLNARRPWHEHIHEKTLEILYMYKGFQIVGVNNKQYVLRGNDVYVVYPDEVHSSGIHPISKNHFYWLLIRIPDNLEHSFGLPGENREMVNRLLKLNRIFKSTNELKNLFDKIITAKTSPEMPLRKTIVRQTMIQALLKLIDDSRNSSTSNYSGDIRKVINFIEANSEKNLQLDKLAQVVGLSPSRLRQKFRKQAGITLSEYIMRKKIDHAIELISQDKLSLTEIAFRLSFSSSQYFATVFKRYVNCTPSEFSKNLELKFTD